MLPQMYYRQEPRWHPTWSGFESQRSSAVKSEPQCQKYRDEWSSGTVGLGQLASALIHVHDRHPVGQLTTGDPGLRLEVNGHVEDGLSGRFQLQLTRAQALIIKCPSGAPAAVVETAPP